MTPNRRTAAFIATMLLICALTPMAQARDPSKPNRVVSMNLCTDQLVLLLADPGQLHSVSYVSHDPNTSVLAKQARRYKPNHGHAEQIFQMRPDLILAGAFTRRATTQLLKRLGFSVETFYPARSFADIRANIARIGRLLGRPARTAEVLATFDAELKSTSLEKATGGAHHRAALYYSNNYTSGSGTLAADIVAHAGLDNIGTRLGLAGIVKLPLELLIVGAPDVIIAEQRDSKYSALAYQTFAHPALKAAARDASAFVHTDKTWSCGAPFTIGAVRRLQAAARIEPLKTVQ